MRIKLKPQQRRNMQQAKRPTPKPLEAAQYHFTPATLNDPFRQLVCMAGKAPKTDFDKFISQLQDENPMARDSAIEELTNLNDERTVPFITRILETHPEHKVRRDAIKVLGNLKNRKAVASLIRCARSDTRDSVRQDAIIALGEIRDRRATIPLIYILLNDPNHTTRSNAATALGKIKDKRAVSPLLASLMFDPGPDVREGAAFTLWEIGGIKTAENLIEAIISEYPLQEEFLVGRTLSLVLEPYVEREMSGTVFFNRPAKAIKERSMWLPTIPASIVQRFNECMEEEKKTKEISQKISMLFAKADPTDDYHHMDKPIDPDDPDLPSIRSELPKLLNDDYKIVKSLRQLNRKPFPNSKLTHFFVYLLASSKLPISLIPELNKLNGWNYDRYKSGQIGWEDFWHDFGRCVDPAILEKLIDAEISEEELITFLDAAKHIDAILKKPQFYKQRRTETLTIIDPDCQHLFSQDFFDNPSAYIESQPRISRGPAFEIETANGQTWEYDSTKVREFSSIVSKRIDPLAVDHPAEEIEAADGIRRKLQKAGDRRFKVQEFIGFVYDRDNFYLLSRKEEGAIDLWELFQNPIPLVKRMYELKGSVTAKELITLLAEIQGAFNWLKDLLKDDLKDLTARNVLVRLLDNGELEFTLIDFETR